MVDALVRTVPVSAKGRRWRHVTSWDTEGTAGGNYELNFGKRARPGDLCVITHSSRNYQFTLDSGFERRNEVYEGEDFGVAAKVWEATDDAVVPYTVGGGGTGNAFLISAHVFRPSTPASVRRLLGWNYSTRWYSVAAPAGSIVVWMYTNILTSSVSHPGHPFIPAWSGVVNNSGYYVPMVVDWAETARDGTTPTNGVSSAHKHYAAFGVLAA